MATSKDDKLVRTMQAIECHKCGGPLKKVSWKITAGAFDAGKEVEQTVYKCDKDDNFISFEMSTGNPSEFAGAYYDKDTDSFRVPEKD